MVQILATNKAESDWSLQSSGTSFPLSSIFFVDTLHGWVCNGEDLIKTTNSGNNWFSIYLAGYAFGECYFLDTSKGWACGSNDIFKTTNGGLNWSLQNSGTSNLVNSLCFLDSLNGWASADPGPILHTSNGGLNWISQNAGIHRFVSISFANSLCGAVCSQDAIICATSNGGNNWEIVFNDSDYLNLTSTSSIFMLRTPDSGNPHGWCPMSYSSGGYGDMLLTNSDCLAWGYIGLTNGIFSIYFTSPNCGWIGRNANAIYHTTDGCTNWYNQTAPSGNGYLSSIFFSDSLHGWACSTMGQILHTTDGGGAPVGLVHQSSNVPVNFRLYQNYPNPFNPATKIKFDLPKSSFVTLAIYDLLGKEITKLVNEEYKTTGTYEIEWDGSNFASGVYLCKLSSEEITLTKKMVLMK